MAYSGPDLSPICSLEIANDIFLFGAHTGLIRGFYIDDPFTACELVGHKNIVRDLTLTPSGGHLYSASKDGTVKSWDMQTKEEDESRSVSNAGVECVRTTKTHVMCGSSDGYLAGWKAGAKEKGGGAMAFRLKAHVGNISSLVVDTANENNAQLRCLSTSNDGTARYIDAGTGQLIAVYDGCGPLLCSALSEETQAFYVGGSHKNVIIYDVRCAVSIGQLRGHSEAVTGMALYSASSFDLPVEEPKADTVGITLPRGSLPVNTAPSTQTQATMYTSSEDGKVMQWNLATNTCEYVFHGHSAPVTCIKYTSAGQLFTGSVDSSVRIWDVQSAFNNVKANLILAKEVKNNADQSIKEKKEREKSSARKSKKDKKKSKEKKGEAKPAGDSGKKKSSKKKKKKK